MSSFIARSRRRFAILPLLALTALPAVAQTPLTGNVYDGSGGPLLSGTVYHATSINIPASQTLTVQPGAIVKFEAGAYFTISGTLHAVGTSGSQIIFTSVNDDTAGGDTNMNGGTTVPAKGDWTSLFFYAGSDMSILDYVQVRYAGASNYGGIDFQSGAAISLTHSTIRDCAASAVKCNGTPTGATIANCTFTNNNGNAIYQAVLTDVPGFTSNTAIGNGGNYIYVSGGGIAANKTITSSSCLGGALVMAADITITAGVTLTLNSGVVIKFVGTNGVYCLGRLNTNGSAGTPVVFTELRDDTIGGDTNGDGGASVPVKGTWYSVFLYAGAAGSVINRAEVRYGGAGSYGGIDTEAAVTASVTNCKVRDCSGAAIEMHSFASALTVTGTALQNNTSVAVNNVVLSSVPGFTGNTATGNGGNYLRVTDANVNSDVTINYASCLSNPLVLASNVNIAAGKTLTINQDVIVKFQLGNYFAVAGTLIATGIPLHPVIFTEFRDDSAGGDTNGDANASTPQKGSWYSIYYYAGSTANVLDQVEVRYAGAGTYGAIDFQGAAPLTMTATRVRESYADGMEFRTYAPAATVRRCSFENNNGIAINTVPLEVVPNFSANLATGNGGNYIRVTSASISTDLALGAETCMGGALVSAVNWAIPVGRKLTLEPGFVCKFETGNQLVVNGAIDALGTAAKPVVFTEIHDDGVGGDTNQDGNATLPTKGFWYGMFVYAAAPSRLSYVDMRYAGTGAYAAITIQNLNTTVSDCRAEHCYSHGFEFNPGGGEARGLTAWDCDGYGINLLGGSFNIRQATCVACAYGLSKTSTSWTGIVRDTIAWSNTAANYNGFAAGEVRYSDGIVGGTGNINANPSFVNQASGNLHLLGTSPCINAGDPLSQLDPDCSPADMGAYPFDHGQAPFTYCNGKANSAGCVPSIAFSGFASKTSPAPFVARAIDVVNNKSGLFFYGLNGQLNLPFQGGTKCVADPVKRTPIINSGGSALPNDCSGVFTIDINALIQSNIDAALIAGATVDLQCWYRDPGMPSTTGLSNALQFRICN
jgi:hypothetical protein